MRVSAIPLLGLFAGLVVFIAGSINMRLISEQYVESGLFMNGIRRLYIDENNSGVFTEAIKDNKVRYINGIEKNVIEKLVCNNMYPNDEVPLMYRNVLRDGRFQQCFDMYSAIMSDIRYFPVPHDVKNGSGISYENSWGDERNYGGTRTHEGTDIMADNNKRGYFPVVSMTDGVVEKIGWLKLGGYRVGVRSSSGAYFYYAHLCEYADGIEEGTEIKAGMMLGTMGDTGYSEVEGTVGQFPVHLHLGIYLDINGEEISFNPYYILKNIEKYRREFI